MSFQAYLDNMEVKTGKTPNEIIALAKKGGLNTPETKSNEIVTWLKNEFDLGHGHAMAMAHVIKNGAKISNKHVGAKGAHGDETSTLRLSGKKKDK